MRVAEDEAGGLEGAEAAAVDDGAFVAVAALHQRQNLVQHIFLESDMAADTIGRMAAEVVEGFAREALDAEQLQMTGLELVGEAGNDSEMFIFPKSALPALGTSVLWRRHARTPEAPCHDGADRCTSADILGS